MNSDETSNGKGLKVAEMVQSGNASPEAIQRAEGIWESRGIGNSYLVTTDAGDVLVNAGTLADARRGQNHFSRISDHQIRYIILTQSHANQYGGLELYKTAENLVVAHRIYPQDRTYGDLLSAHYRRGSRRIFGGITGNTEDMIPTAEVAPDILIDDDGYRFELGGRRFEVICVELH
jgi:glyoxylase-like metal-dependent hydrolase (beta-lactamase superfamily II)